MRKAGAWSAVNAVSAHFYPPAKEGPATRAKYIKTVKTASEGCAPKPKSLP